MTFEKFQAFIFVWVFYAILWTVFYFMTGNLWLLIPTFLMMGPVLFFVFIFLYNELWAKHTGWSNNQPNFGSIDEL